MTDGTPYWLVAGRSAAHALTQRADDIQDALLNGRPTQETGRPHRPDPRRPPLDVGIVDLDIRLDRRSRELVWLLVDLAGIQSPPTTYTARERFAWIADNINKAPATPSTRRLIDELVQFSAHASRALGHRSTLRRIHARCPICAGSALLVDTLTWTATCINPGCATLDGKPKTHRLEDLTEVRIYTGLTDHPYQPTST